MRGWPTGTSTDSVTRSRDEQKLGKEAPVCHWGELRTTSIKAYLLSTIWLDSCEFFDSKHRFDLSLTTISTFTIIQP